MNTATLLRSGSATDPGLARSNNEDRVYADDEHALYLVVDGLGGHAAGERAAALAVETIVAEFNVDVPDAEPEIRRAVTAANNAIFAAASGDPACSGMACVLTLAAVRDDKVIVGHVGDSRLYLIWNGTARKITSDHSPVGEQADQGQLTEAEAMMHPARNVVFRDVGSRRREPDDPDFVDVRTFPFHPEAALLLCTDGLSDALTSSDIATIVETFEDDPATIARVLVEAAKDLDGSDNISVVFVAGPEFAGTPRARHTITRPRHRGMWRATAARLLWVVLGILLGLAIWPAWEHLK